MVNAWAMRPLPGTVTADSTAAGFDPSYVMNDYSGVVWQSAAGAASRTLTVDLGVAVAVNAALLFGCTGATTGWTLTVEAADNSGFSSGYVLHQSAAQFVAGATFPSHGRGVGYWEAAGAVAAKRYWRFTIGGLGGAAATVARLALGVKVQLARNFAFGGAFGLRDLGTLDFSPAGAMLRRRAAKLRTLGISFPAAHKDEVETKIQPLVELVGGQEPIVLVTDPAANAQRQTRCYFGPLVGEMGTIQRNAAGWEWRVNLVDLIAIPKAA